MVLVPMLFGSSIMYAEEAVIPSPKPSKKILILSSNGGNGHNAAASALKTLLGDKYELKIVYPIDQLHIWGVRSGEQFYNTMLQFNLIRSMNVISKYVAPKLFRTRKKKIEELVQKYVDLEKPNLVISLIPFINLPASEAARKSGIPFLLVTTDNDLRNWVHGLQGVSHPNFKVTIGNDLPSTRAMLHQRKVPDSSIEMIGLPLRPDFQASKSLQELHLEYGVPTDKSVILIMMGGAGSESALEYTKKIGSMEIGAHLIVIAGKNEKLARKLKKIKLHPSNSISVLGFTDKVADFMSLSDLIITKPGPGTINEAIAMRLPILIDNTSVPLRWEKTNIELVLKYGIGDRITDEDDAEILLNRYLKDEKLRDDIQQAFTRLPPNHFNERIIELVDSMCEIKKTDLIVEQKSL